MAGNAHQEVNNQMALNPMKKTAPAFAAITLTVLALLPGVASAEGLPARLTCNLTSGTSTTYEGGKFLSVATKPLAIEIANINLDKQSAELIGSNAKAPGSLKIVRAINANHFIEVVNEGFMNLTTVYDVDGKSGGYPVVHSRHLGILGQPIFAQYTGLCRKKEK